ncbi:uncharacterized protein LOC131428256 [Malaya genurostris]|uniref:uncharacterized protein LOC131428256 n=1 Tax=Malaya genurostris TaxID=325434 RepID=UPI0026F3B235|nr:uncharacterized protein LOC131428256 [Malaya genurostris]
MNSQVVSRIDDDNIKPFMLENAITSIHGGNKLGRKARSKLLKNVLIENFNESSITKSSVWIRAQLKEVSNGPVGSQGYINEEKTLTTHNIELNINKTAIKSVKCTDCDKCDVKCPQIFTFLVWLQNEQKKVKNERNQVHALKPEKEEIQVSLVELKSAKSLSMFSLIREFSTSDPDEFLLYCTKRMQEENCSNALMLTVGQTGIYLRNELRKGRITASSLHDASRCSLKNDSITKQVMRTSLGLSFTVSRGTDLEGRVFAVLKEQYPSLRETGLVLDPELPWMGASPDGISDDFVLEIKCPNTPRKYKRYIDVKKLPRKCFAQIQLQMHLTHNAKALLGVAAVDFETTRNVAQVWIEYNRQYVDKVVKDACKYWKKSVFPALLGKRTNKTKT